MICHCGKKMYRLRAGKLNVSGMYREVLMCHDHHTLTLLEGMPVWSMGFRLECALNASAVHCGILKPWLRRDSGTARETSKGVTSPSRSKGSAEILSLQTWGLSISGVHGLSETRLDRPVRRVNFEMRNGSAASSTENHRDNASAVAGETDERKAA